MQKVSTLYESSYIKSFMLLLLFFYSFLFVPYPEVAKIIFSLFLILSLPLFLVFFKKFRKDIVFILFFVAFFVQFFSWVNSQYYFSEFSNDYPKFDRLLKLFSFIFIAYWLNGSQKNTLFVLGAFTSGFILSIFSSTDFLKDFQQSLYGIRVDFGIKNAQFTSMLAGVSCIISVFILFNTYLSKKYLYFKRNIYFLLSLPVLFFAYLILVSQTRQVWLAFIIIIFLFPLLLSYIYSNISKTKIFFSYIICFLCLYSISFISIVERRMIEQTFEREKVVFNKLLSKDFNEIPSTGNGIRVKSWIEAFTWITKHPFIGSDASAINEVMLKSKLFSKNKKKTYKHLHSFHIEILVAYGILGALVIYTMYFWLIRSLVLAHRENPELKIYTVLGICFLIFWIIINFFESFSSRSYGVYVHNIMFGCLYTFYFAQQRKKIEEAEACA